MTTDNIERIAARIEVLCQGALSLHSSYLLSELGKDLGPDLAMLKSLTKSSLSHFIRTRFSEKFVIVLTGQFNNVQALIRAPGTSAEQAILLSETITVERDIVARPPSPRFNYRFWAAFSVPYREGKRFLNLSNFTFQDITSDECPEEHIEIPLSFIVEPAIQDRDKAIAENINRWIEENHLNRSDFLQTRALKDYPVQSSTNLSLLEVIVSTLRPSSTFEYINDP